jgi:putative ABC transport system substrate-binding protein
LQILTEAFSHVTRIAALHCPDSTVGESQWRETQLAVEKLKLGLISAGVRSAAEVDEVLTSAEAKGAEAIPFLDCSWIPSEVARSDVRSKAPRMYWSDRFVREGGLMSYGADLEALGYRSASYVDRILKGTRPADLPIELPTKFKLVVNLKTARAIGLNLPSSLLARADEVIE